MTKNTKYVFLGKNHIFPVYFNPQPFPGNENEFNQDDQQALPIREKTWLL
ncbi:MAG: hypothetical protein V7K61_04515 [Nostoc sp.]